MRLIFKRCKLKRDKRTGKPRPRSAVATLAYVYRELKNQGDVVAIEGRATGGGVITGNAKLDAIALGSRAPEGKSQVGHYTLAAEGNGGPETTAKLLRAGHAWAARYLGGRGYVLVVHGNHLHIVVELYDDKGRALYIDDEQYEAMKRLEFTSEFEANDQTPRPDRPGRTFDPKAVRSHANRFAMRLLRGETSWKKMIREKEITPGREKDGKMTSFDFKDEKGRVFRIKVATVEGFVASERQRQATAQTKVKARELGEQAKKIMGQGLGDLIDQVDEIAQGEPTQTPSRGRAR